MKTKRMKDYHACPGEVADVFIAYPRNLRGKLLFLRKMIFDVSSENKDVGKLEEFLKWGKPAYRLAGSKHSITIRISRKNRSPTEYAMHFHGTTGLIGKLRALFPSIFRYDGNSIVLDESDVVPVKELRACIYIALIHHRTRKTERMRRAAQRQLT